MERGCLSDRVGEINNLIGMADTECLSLGDEEGKTSIGLKNIAERIKLHYGSTFYLKIAEGMENGTEIDILIPGQWKEAGKMGDSYDL